MPPEDKLKLLQHVRANWAELKQDTGLVTQFKEVVFIPVKGVPTKARSLFDPRRNVLKDIFGDEPDAFPQSGVVARFVLPSTPHVKLKVGDTECPLQVCQLSRSSESTHFRSFVEM